MINRTKNVYICKNCKTKFTKWTGYCSNCQSWNTLIDHVESNNKFYFSNNHPHIKKEVCLLSEINLNIQLRVNTGIEELDRILGGGLVLGSAILIGGNPGIGKSTLLLQMLGNLSKIRKVLYVTGEESLEQIATRAQRLKVSSDTLLILAETQMEQILNVILEEKPDIIAIDSIQTVYTSNNSSIPGSINQIRECTGQLISYIKQMNVILFVVGHVTKEGILAGPKILEHIVDCVLYFEGEKDSNFRIIRATKNRFGSINELGIFAMVDHGLKEILNPSIFFLANREVYITGSIVFVTVEGNCPLLIEVQALIDKSYLINPRRVSVGIDPNRLAILLAILHRHGNISTHNQDIFINIVGGVKISDTAVDLAILLVVLSSIYDKPLDSDLVVFGELGLAGEIRPVQHGLERIKAAARNGFKKIILPVGNMPEKNDMNIELIAVNKLIDIMQII